MLKLKLKAAAVVILAAFLACQAAVPATAATFAEAYADVAFDLLGNCAKNGKNTMISPASVFFAVNMAENGAAGKTRKEMEDAFGQISTKKTTSQLSKLSRRLSASKSVDFWSPCAIWYAKGLVTLRKPYSDVIRKAYGAVPKASAFDEGTVKDINSWVSSNTNGKINSIIDKLDPLDRLVLVNATYFKGEWADPYSGSRKRKFTKNGGETKKVPMLEGIESEYFEVGGAKCFAKKYIGGEFSFVAILPAKGTTVRSFLSKTDGKDVLKAYRRRKTSGIAVKTRLPKFRYSFSASMKKPLMKLGVKTAFASSADFSKMTKTKVHVDDVLHKTFIEVDEKGTEAAAVTAVIAKANSVLNPPAETKTVYLNRPFIYEIVETATGLPVFIGIVNDP